MRLEDARVLDGLLCEWSNEIKLNKNFYNKIVICSPTEQEVILAKNHFKGANIILSRIEQWDLNNPCPYKNVGLIIACNVFMYCKNNKQQLWYNNIMNSSQFFIMQDVIRSYRGPNQELGNDGDSTRFCYGDEYKARIENAFDLVKWQNNIVDIAFYEHESHLSFIGYFKNEKSL